MTWSPNGCGPGNWRRHTWRWNIARWLTPGLAAACDRHDRAYEAGGTEADRLAADEQLRADVLAVAASSWWPLSAFLRVEAAILYDLVRTYGRAHFHYREAAA